MESFAIICILTLVSYIVKGHSALRNPFEKRYPHPSSPVKNMRLKVLNAIACICVRHAEIVSAAVWNDAGL
jgi:hypothetical protein